MGSGLLLPPWADSRPQEMLAHVPWDVSWHLGSPSGNGNGNGNGNGIFLTPPLPGEICTGVEREKWPLQEWYNANKRDNEKVGAGRAPWEKWDFQHLDSGVVVLLSYFAFLC